MTVQRPSSRVRVALVVAVLAVAGAAVCAGAALHLQAEARELRREAEEAARATRSLAAALPAPDALRAEIDRLEHLAAPEAGQGDDGPATALAHHQAADAVAARLAPGDARPALAAALAAAPALLEAVKGLDAVEGVRLVKVEAPSASARRLVFQCPPTAVARVLHGFVGSGAVVPATALEMRRQGDLAQVVLRVRLPDVEVAK